ncbi:hypothetical protein [Dyadobacter sp. NIV53]|uniref:hypothetical protein n=1 Tax=Dyadobacter sp. NIV53 TaxID=2861765 RepID=UPI001C867163|nr:hypothetical protein [Dyadobacter sp. NIV53]
MKKFLPLFGLCLLVSLCSNAKIWRVNNNNGITADFTTLQAAHDGAKSGDTLHLEGSPNNYGGLNSTKKLVIIGPGFFLDQNSGLQAFAITAIVNGISYNAGSEGSEVLGIDFAANGINVFCNDIVIKRNKFCTPNGENPDWSVGTINLYYDNRNSSLPVNNIIISQNFGVIVNVQYASAGVLITNNYLGVQAYLGDDTESTVISIHTSAVVLIQNNIFRRGKVTSYNSSVSNNIMYAGFFEGTGNLISNNIGSKEQFGTGNGNKSNVDMTKVFEQTGSSDAFWTLKAGSPAIGGGYGSTSDNPIDCGMFGGYSAYKLSGIPPVPAIYSFENQPIGSTTDPIDVTVKVRSNN